MADSIVVAGIARSGTTLLYNMLRTTVTNYRFFDHEMPANRTPKKGWISKRPLDCFEDHGREQITLIRDPRAIITSHHWMYPDDWFMGAEKARTGHKGVIQWWKAIQKRPGFLIRYEDLVRDPQTHQEILGTRFGLEYEGEFADFWRKQPPLGLRRALNGVRPVDSPRDWRKNADRVVEECWNHPELRSVILEMGYEHDDDWWKALCD